MKTVDRKLKGREGSSVSQNGGKTREMAEDMGGELGNLAAETSVSSDVIFM